MAAPPQFVLPPYSCVIATLKARRAKRSLNPQPRTRSGGLSWHPRDLAGRFLCRASRKFRKTLRAKQQGLYVLACQLGLDCEQVMRRAAQSQGFRPIHGSLHDLARYFEPFARNLLVGGSDHACRLRNCAEVRRRAFNGFAGFVTGKAEDAAELIGRALRQPRRDVGRGFPYLLGGFVILLHHFEADLRSTLADFGGVASEAAGRV